MDSPQATLGRRDFSGAALGLFEIPAPLLEQEGWREAPGW